MTSKKTRRTSMMGSASGAKVSPLASNLASTKKSTGVRARPTFFTLGKAGRSSLRNDQNSSAGSSPRAKGKHQHADEPSRTAQRNQRRNCAAIDCLRLESCLLGGLFFQRLPPGRKLSRDLLPRTSFSVYGASPEAVVAHDFIGGDNELEVPSRVGCLKFRIVAPTAGRMTEADAVAAVKHQEEYLFAVQAV